MPNPFAPKKTPTMRAATPLERLREITETTSPWDKDGPRKPTSMRAATSRERWHTTLSDRFDPLPPDPPRHSVMRATTPLERLKDMASDAMSIFMEFPPVKGAMDLGVAMDDLYRGNVGQDGFMLAGMPEAPGKAAFYSRTERAAQKLPKTVKPESLINELRKFGAPLEEIQLRKLETLASPGGAPIARDAIIEHLNQNQLPFDFIEYGSTPLKKLTPEEAREVVAKHGVNGYDWADSVEDLDPQNRIDPDYVVNRELQVGKDWFQRPNGKAEAGVRLSTPFPEGPTVYGPADYQGEFLTLPAEATEGGVRKSINPENYRETLMQYTGRPWGEKPWEHPHWFGKRDVVGHSRTSTREMPSYPGLDETYAYMFEGGPAPKPLKGNLIEEVQSDVHQHGARRGYDDNPVLHEELAQSKRALGALEAELDQLYKDARELRELDYQKSTQTTRDDPFRGVDWLNGLNDPSHERYRIDQKLKQTEAKIKELNAQYWKIHEKTVNIRENMSGLAPNMPLKNHAWEDVQLKNEILRAVNEDRDFIGLVGPQVQLDRYPGVEKSVDALSLKPSFLPETGTKGYRLEGHRSEGVPWWAEHTPPFRDDAAEAAFDASTDSNVFIGPNGKRIYNKFTTNPQQATRFLDPAVAQELLNATPNERGIRSIQAGDRDIRVGGDGHRVAYGERLPTKLQKILKPFGAEVTQAKMPTPSLPDQPIWMAKLTPEIKERIRKEGLPFLMFLAAMQQAQER
jgi:hypothetical protein